MAHASRGRTAASEARIQYEHLHSIPREGLGACSSNDAGTDYHGIWVYAHEARLCDGAALVWITRR
jgi:hypothetical protein